MAGMGIARGLQAFALRALLLVRHHYFSLLTAAVLGAVALIATTSPGTEETTPASSRDEASLSAARWGLDKSTYSARGRSLIYYLVESEDQALAIQYAMHGDMAASDVSSGRDNFGLVYYLMAETILQEADVSRLLNTIVEMAPQSGFFVAIIDLRP
jgi:hypothetical protein